MFLDTPRMPEPCRPEPPKRKLSKRGETVLLWVVGFNLLVLVIAPVGGVTLFDALTLLFTKPGQSQSQHLGAIPAGRLQ